MVENDDWWLPQPLEEIEIDEDDFDRSNFAEIRGIITLRLNYNYLYIIIDSPCDGIHTDAYNIFDGHLHNKNHIFLPHNKSIWSIRSNDHNKLDSIFYDFDPIGTMVGITNSLWAYYTPTINRHSLFRRQIQTRKIFLMSYRNPQSRIAVQCSLNKWRRRLQTWSAYEQVLALLMANHSRLGIESSITRLDINCAWYIYYFILKLHKK